MADFSIKSPAYSFIVFDKVEVEDNCCDGNNQFCIPVIEESDCNFQFKITSTDQVKIDSLLALDLSQFQLVLLKNIDNTVTTIAANILRNWTLGDGFQFERYRTGLFEITFIWKNNFKDIKTLLNCDDCFQLAFVKNLTIAGTPGSFSDDFSEDFDTGGLSVLFDFCFFSNCFKLKCDDCYTAVLEYYNDEDYADFRYCNVGLAANKVRLPLHLTSPKTVEDKVVYRKSNGKIKQLKSLITKEYLILTDHFPELIHDKIAVALGHDTVNIYSERYTGGISKNGEYAIEWVDNICKAPAQFKAVTDPFIIRNNNCADCAEVDLLLTCAELIGLELTSERMSGIDSGTDWQVNITGCSYAVAPVSGYNQTVEIYYREKFSLGAYTLAGTAIFNSLGVLISSPNPLVISPLSDTWNSIEIKAVNLCDSSELIVYKDNPCSKMVGIIGNTTDGGTTWGIDITNIVYSIWPPFGAHRTLDVYYREFGSSTTYTFAGSIDFVVNAGYVVTLTPNPFSITGIDSAWEKVELAIEYGIETMCQRELVEVFSSPLSGCTAVSVVSVDDIQSDNVSLSWPRVIPTPAGLYDWELATDSGFTTIVQSGNAWNPGSTILLLLSTLTPLTHYYFRVRSVCAPGEFSSWTTIDFSTISPFTLHITEGVNAFSVGSPSGVGTITGPVGGTCIVHISAIGAGSGWYLDTGITGATPSGPTDVTDGTSTYSFIMPVGGIIGWTASFIAPGGSSAGSGSIHL